MTILQKIQSLLTAANTKTGESDTTLTDAVQTLIDGYGQGGGGSLPSVISKIDGGSFTLSNDTQCNTYSITTTLNDPAKYFLIWTDDLDSFGAISNKGLILAMVNIRQFESASGTTRYGCYSYIQRQTNGSSYQSISTMTYANQPGKFTGNNTINYNVSDTYYIAGKLYKWLAFV